MTFGMARHVRCESRCTRGGAPCSKASWWSSLGACSRTHSTCSAARFGVWRRRLGPRVKSFGIERRISEYVVCMMGVKNKNHHTHPLRRKGQLLVFHRRIEFLRHKRRRQWTSTCTTQRLDGTVTLKTRATSTRTRLRAARRAQQLTTSGVARSEHREVLRSVFRHLSLRHDLQALSAPLGSIRPRPRRPHPRPLRRCCVAAFALADPG